MLIAWCLLTLASLAPVTALLAGSFPIFTVLWILVPLVVVLKSKDASRVGFRPISWREFVRVSAINLAGLFLISLAIEPWSHTYQKLLEAALAGRTPDTTFAWLLRYPRLPGLGGLPYGQPLAEPVFGYAGEFHLRGSVGLEVFSMRQHEKMHHS